MSEEKNPYQAPRETGITRKWLPSFIWFLVGTLLTGFGGWALPGAIDTVREPHRWHGFEVQIGWFWIYSSPFIILSGVTMMVWSILRFQRN